MLLFIFWILCDLIELVSEWHRIQKELDEPIEQIMVYGLIAAGGPVLLLGQVGNWALDKIFKKEIKG